jgi:two-component system chemotaxis response regulator CheB
MISSLTKRGATQTMEALNLGATDFITKEQAFGLRDDQAAQLGENIHQKLDNLLKASSPRKVALKTEPVMDKASVAPRGYGLVQKDKSPVHLLLVGSSTGGPQTLQEVFKQMKPRRNYAIVVVQHMPPVFTAQLAMNLSKVTGHEFVEADEGLLIKKGMVVIAKGGYHLELIKSSEGWTCHLAETPPVNSCRPSVDVTFESVARQIKTVEVVSVMLTGMGADGAKGCQALSQKRVPVITQERESCVVYGMPKAVDDLGIATCHAKPTFVISESERFMLHPEQM